jgi:hypothetical protein
MPAPTSSIRPGRTLANTWANRHATVGHGRPRPRPNRHRSWATSSRGRSPPAWVGGSHTGAGMYCNRRRLRPGQRPSPRNRRLRLPPCPSGPARSGLGRQATAPDGRGEIHSRYVIVALPAMSPTTTGRDPAASAQPIRRAASSQRSTAAIRPCPIGAPGCRLRCTGLPHTPSRSKSTHTVPRPADVPSVQSPSGGPDLQAG